MSHLPLLNTLQEAELFEELTAAIKCGDLSRRDAVLRLCPQLQEWLDGWNLVTHLKPGEPGSTIVHQRTSHPTLPAPGRLGRYELLEEVGRGGMGVVFRARHLDLDREVALKMILAADLARPEEVRRFQAEARTVAQLRHPNIVAVHDIDEYHGRHFFAMDFIDGECLSSIIARERIAPEQAARWMVSIADAVQHLHDRGIIHRDLKPSNILLDRRGIPIVTDFGLAKIFEGDGKVTRSGAILGTPSYMAPEQASGRNDLISPRSDVYSLGAIFYELLTGRPPFYGETPLETIVQVLESEPPLPRSLVPRLPRSVELICLKCLERLPESRYRSAAEFGADLTRFLGGDPIEAQPGGPVQRITRWVRRHPNLACHLLALGAALLILQTYYVVGDTISLTYHMRMCGVLAVWALFVSVWERLTRSTVFAQSSAVVTVLGDVVFLTTALAMSDHSIGQMLVVYSLLITASGLWFRPRLVWFTTVAAEIGYLVLCSLNSALLTPWHYPLLVITVLAFLGAATVYQVHRVHALSRFYGSRPLP